jgi:ribonucleotide reductase beta subunit family protein with ferritin-like domain
MEEEAVTPEGGEDTSKASKKGKLEMPLERLKAIMEKKKSEAYKAMLRSQGKMEEEAEQVDEKMLTKAEMKKREEVAKAIKRDQPGMPMGKKMAIATATAKKVAEELVGNQHKIDANKNNKIDAHDFKLLRAKKKTMKEFVEQLAESLSSKAE